MKGEESSAELVSSVHERISSAVSSIIVGQEQATKLLCTAFLASGHALIEGPPGIAKSFLARTFATALALSFRRIQFTPDLMPSDITGVNVFDPSSGSFRFVAGPLFAQVVLADEINRTPPKTQAALLEAMEERSITIDGVMRELGELFFVVATQNPIEHEGTFPLPEAQLDRFLLKINMSYPTESEEIRMLQDFTGTRFEQHRERELVLPSTLSDKELSTSRRAVSQISLTPTLAGYILALANATRSHPDLVLGVSPRAVVHLGLAAKVAAACSGRSYVIPDDVASLVTPVWAHRLIFKPEVMDSGRNSAELLRGVLERIAVPQEIMA